MDFLATSKPRIDLLLSVLEILDDEDTRLAQMLSSRPSIVVVASRSRSVACLLSAVDSLRLFVVMVIGSPFSRILLHAVLATTLVTVYIPMLFTDELLHPCRLAHHGWRPDCLDRVDQESFDIFATTVNLVGFAIGGYLSARETGRRASPWLRGFCEAMKTGFLAAFMSYPYIVQHAAHISVRKDSIALGVLYIFAVGAFGTLIWRVGWCLGGGSSDLSSGGSGGGGGSGAFDNASSSGVEAGRLAAIKIGGGGGDDDYENTASTTTTTIRQLPPPSAHRHLSLKEGAVIGGFVVVTWAWFRRRHAPMDALDPDFVKYHLLAIPVGAELLLNASFAILGVAASSLVPWHRENLVDSCVQLLLGFSACCCALWPARSGGGAGAGSNTNGLTGRLLPDSSSSSSSSSSSASSNHPTGDMSLEHAKGCLLANLVSFGFLIGAYMSANVHPHLLDSPIFVAYISSFTGSMSNLEGMVSYSMVLFRRRRRFDGMVVYVANAVVATGAMLLIRTAMLFSEQTQPASARSSSHIVVGAGGA